MHVGVSPWYDVSHTVMNSVWPWPLTSISKLYFHNEFESGKMSLLFDIGTPNFCIWVYHHETCCVHSGPKCDFDLWPICGWRGVSLVSFTQFLSCYYYENSLNLIFQHFLKSCIVNMHVKSLHLVIIVLGYFSVQIHCVWLDRWGSVPSHARYWPLSGNKRSLYIGDHCVQKHTIT